MNRSRILLLVSAFSMLTIWSLLTQSTAALGYAVTGEALMPGFVPLLGPLLFFFPLALFAQRFMGLRETIQYGVWALFISNIAGYFFGGGGPLCIP